MRYLISNIVKDIRAIAQECKNELIHNQWPFYIFRCYYKTSGGDSEQKALLHPRFIGLMVTTQPRASIKLLQQYERDLYCT